MVTDGVAILVISGDASFTGKTISFKIGDFDAAETDTWEQGGHVNPEISISVNTSQFQQNLEQQRIDQQRIAEQQAQQDQENRARIEQNRLRQQQEEQQRLEQERERVAQEQRLERERLTQQQEIERQRLEQERQMEEQRLKQNEELERQRLDQESKLTEERLQQQRELEQQRLEREREQAVLERQKREAEVQPSDVPVAIVLEKEPLPSRGFFTNSASGSLGDLNEFLDPTSLAVLGILLTLLATSLSLVKGN